MNLEEQIDAAIRLRDAERLPEAIEALKLTLHEFPARKSVILGLMGGFYFHLKDYENAQNCFSRTVELSPRSEMASLGLFHSNWELGRKDEAFAEANRFLNIAPSEKYDLLFDEMADELENLRGPRDL